MCKTQKQLIISSQLFNVAFFNPKGISPLEISREIFASPLKHPKHDYSVTAA